MIVTVALIALSALALEASRISWHSRRPAGPWLIVAHAAAAAMLAAMLEPWLAPLAAGSVFVSWGLLDSKRAGAWPGELASGLSAYPWHGAALLALGWPEGLPSAWPDSLWALLPSAWVLAGLPIGWVAGLPWVSGLRPVHWTPSRHVWAYPRRLRRFLGEPARMSEVRP